VNKPGFIQKIKRKYQDLKSWYLHGSEIAQIVVDFDDLTDEFRSWVEESEDEWEETRRMPIETLYNELSQFHQFIDVDIEKEASDIENRIEKLRREINNERVPPYIDELMDNLEKTVDHFEHERTLVRNAVIKAENGLDANEKPLDVAHNLADIEESETDDLKGIEDSITDMRRVCVNNNLVKALKISRILP